MAIPEDSATIVTPVDIAPAAQGPRGAVSPSAMTVEQLARALGITADTVRRHMEEGAPVSADGTINLIHYAAWLNKRLRNIDGD